MRAFRNKFLLFFFISSLLTFGGVNVYAQEEALFTSVAPDALIILDLSGSMRWTPAGSVMYTATTTTCTSTTLPF